MARYFERVGHRGAPHLFPGNTMQGFRRAVEMGCTMVECDVRQAADGVIVLAHDPHVYPVDGPAIEVSAVPSSELARLDLGAGEGVPTLSELAEWALGRCKVMADMKCEFGDIEQRVIEALAALDPVDKLIPGAGEESRARFRALDPSLTLSLTLDGDSLKSLSEEQFASYLASITTEAVTWQYPLLTPERIAALHNQRLRVFAWTVDDIETMRQLVESDVDGIISNRPDLLNSMKPHT